jgi:hypothetical protein
MAAAFEAQLALSMGLPTLVLSSRRHAHRR